MKYFQVTTLFIAIVLMLALVIVASANGADFKKENLEGKKWTTDIKGNKVKIGKDLAYDVDGKAIQEDFEPSVTFHKWGQHKLKYKYKGKGFFELPEEGSDKKLKSINKETNEEIHFYKIGEDKFEFEIILKEKPEKNYWEFEVEGWEEYRFEYQTPFKSPEEFTKENGEKWLRQVFPDGIAECPVNVDGSYAVYHKSAKNNEFKTGKFQHIYRPLIKDADGKTTWGTLSFICGIGKVIVDQKWLDNAKYPVSVDPTFGYTSIGALSFSYAEDVIRSVNYGSMIEDGTVTSIYMYGEGFGASPQCALAVYNDSGGASGSAVDAVSSDFAVTVTTPAWYGGAVSQSASLSSGHNYYLASWHDGAGGADQVKWYYDTHADFDYDYISQTFQTGSYQFSDWVHPTSHFNANRRHSIYINYTTSVTVAEFVCDINCGDAGVEDYDNLTDWEAGTDEDLTASNIFIYSGITVTVQIADGVAVTGQTSGSTGTVVHCNPVGGNDQILIKSMSGGFQAGEQICKTGDCANGNITLPDPLQQNEPRVVASCYDDDGVLDDYVTVSGATADAGDDGIAGTEDDHCRVITAPEGERHDGTIDNTGSPQGFCLDPGVGSSYPIYVNGEDYVRISWIRIRDWITTTTTGILVSGSYSLVEECVIHNNDVPTGAGERRGIYILSGGDNCSVRNTMIANIGSDTADCYGFKVMAIKCSIYNSTIYKSISNSSSGRNIFPLNTATVTDRLICINVVAMESTTTDYYVSGNYQFHATSDYNASSDGTSTGGAHDLINLTASDQFVSLTADSEDLHIKDTNADIYRIGEDLSAIFTIDIDNDTRSMYNTGADEYTGGPTMTPTQTMTPTLTQTQTQTQTMTPTLTVTETPHCSVEITGLIELILYNYAGCGATSEDLDYTGSNCYGGTFEWSSDDELVATVDADGIVSAVGVGTCNVTIQCTTIPSCNDHISVEVRTCVTQTPTLTNTLTATQTITATPTETMTPTITQTLALTATPTMTLTASPTHTITQAETPTQTLTASLTATSTATPTETSTSTATSTPTPSSTPICYYYEKYTVYFDECPDMNAIYYECESFEVTIYECEQFEVYYFYGQN